MSRGDFAHETPMRRDYVRYSGTVAVGGLLAGCMGGGRDTGTEPADTTESYTVSMEPVGSVTFDRVPNRWVAYDGGYADMAVALGQADGITGIGSADRYYTAVYDDLPGVDVDQCVIDGYPEVRTREEFYELEAVRNGRVYRGGPLHQGPIHNLFLTERVAKQLYPDEFGDVTDDTELFDRDRLSAIVNGSAER